MNDHVGGLFKQETKAAQAAGELRRAGFMEDSIRMLARKPHYEPVHEDRVQAPSVGRSALRGGVLLGAIGAFIGLLIGLGVLPIPALDTVFNRTNPLFIVNAVGFGLAWGAVTGIILGAAARLLGSRDRVSITSKGVKRGGLLVVTLTDEAHTEAEARRILENHGAVDIQNLTDKWDLGIWSDFREFQSGTEAQPAERA